MAFDAASFVDRQRPVEERLDMAARIPTAQRHVLRHERCGTVGERRDERQATPAKAGLRRRHRQLERRCNLGDRPSLHVVQHDDR